MHLYWFICKHYRAKTPEEKASENAAKRARKRADVEEAQSLNWREVDTSKECFTIKELPPSEAFLGLSFRNNNLKIIDIFNKFLTDSVMDKLYAGFNQDKLHISHRKKTSWCHGMSLSAAYQWQSIAVQIRIIAMQVKSTFNAPIRNHLKASISEAINHFRSLDKGRVANREIIEKLISNMLLDESFAYDISRNFQSVVLQLGQMVAGDEKLFHYTGQSGNVRLCISKPDRLGLWFYEMAGTLSTGLPYLLYLKMHNSQRESVKVASIVQDWVDVIGNIGDSTTSRTYLAFDSYYMDACARDMLKSANINYTASVQPSRFSVEKALIHRTGAADDPGESKAIYNETTKELFVYHWDTQKGVGKKYNLSRGFDLCTLHTKVAQHRGRIPAYDYYKVGFEACDRFNFGIHDKSWPHKRGGRGMLGEFGKHHDFIMACILQNTVNAFISVLDLDQKNGNFKTLCVELADQVYEHSLSYVSK